MESIIKKYFPEMGIDVSWYTKKITQNISTENTNLESLNEIVKKCKGKTSTGLGPAGTGDLYVSALGGRNSKMGAFLGKGFLYKDVINSKMKNVTVEGSELMLDVGKLLLKHVGKKKLPLASFLQESLTKNKKLKIDWKKFNN